MDQSTSTQLSSKEISLRQLIDTLEKHATEENFCYAPFVFVKLLNSESSVIFPIVGSATLGLKNDSESAEVVVFEIDLSKGRTINKI